MSDRRARCDLYAYAQRQGKGDELVVEMKKGGQLPGRAPAINEADPVFSIPSASSARTQLKALYEQSGDGAGWKAKLWANRPRGQSAPVQLQWLQQVLSNVATYEPQWARLKTDSDDQFEYWLLAAQFGK